jgi:diguanylate cyclase (GGDEF)-like protein
MGKIMATTVHKSTDTHNHAPRVGNTMSSQMKNAALSQDAAQHFVNNGDIESLHHQSKEPNIQLKLTSLLQTTLKIEPLFDLFFGQLQHLIKAHSCHYCYPEKNLDIKLGKAATHTADYSLKLQDEILGNIILSRKQRFTESELLHIESLLSILIYPLRNALSYRDAIQQALSDPLTGLGNRGALEQAINHQWQMAQRYDQHFCVLMLDIDHFKNINDTYGHAVGDEAIKAVAHSISATTRQTDVAYRYGGEEFVVILNKSELLGASIIAERIRENIAALEIPVDDHGNHIQLTISIGGSCSAHSKHPSELMKQADQVLYHAKKSGRNRVELSEIEDKNRTQRNLEVPMNKHSV